MPIPKWVVTAGLMAAQVALGMTRRIKGPRLDELSVMTSEYGTPIPRFWGIRRFVCPVIWADDLREEKRTSKTKGGKYTEYRYYGSWAVAIADQEIDAITRIWFDDRLVYQTREPGPISIAYLFLGSVPGAAAKIRLNRNMKVYLGTEDQLPDPTIEDWCEDRYGPDSCPAYRGVSYIVFKDIPLEKLGNRIPQVTVEAVSSKVTHLPYDVIPVDDGVGGLDLSPDFTRVLAWHTGGYEIFDTGSRRSMVIGSWSGASGFIFFGNHIVGTGAFDVYFYTSDGKSLAASHGLNFAAIGCFRAGEYVGLGALTNHTTAQFVTVGGVMELNVGFKPTFYAGGNDGTAWVGGVVGTTLHFHNVDGKAFTVESPIGSNATFRFLVNSEDKLFCRQANTLFIVEPDTETVIASGAASGAGSDLQFTCHDGSDSYWSQNHKYSTLDCSLIQSYPTPGTWYTGAGAQVYEPVSHALLGTPVGTVFQLNWLYLDRIEPGPVTLKTVVDTVSGWVGVTGQDTDELTQQITGYSVTQGSGKDMLDPLLTIHDVDPRPHDFRVQFLVRGASPTGTLEDFVREGDRYKVTVQQDTDVPKKVTVNYADLNADQQTNNVISQRASEAVDSQREETNDLTTYAVSPDEAQQLSDRRLRRLWNERERIELSLTAQDLALEPGDVKTLALDGETRPARLDKMTIRGSVIDCEWIRSEPGLHTLNGATGAAMEGRDPDVIYVPLPTKGFVIDAPLVQDSHNAANPQIYYAAGPYGTGSWPGATVDLDEQPFGFVGSESRATWGYAETVLPTANANLWDRGNVLTISLLSGTLTNCTEADIDENPNRNLLALGADGRWEYINFTTATLTGIAGSASIYELSGFKRGRRGTEVNVSNHATGDGFLLLSGAARGELGLDDVGDALTFNVAPIAGAGADIVVDYEAATLKPYAPARIKWATDGTDLFGTIIRRSRTFSGWLDSGVVALGENSEAYEVDIMDGTDVVRTITVSGTNEFTYTAAQLSADGNSVSSPPNVNVYQLSEEVGRGFALAA